MSLWDEEFIRLCRHLGIQVDLYRRYVDDILMVIGEINPGWYINTKKKILGFDPDPECHECPNKKELSVSRRH